jgi:hypothetical protein
MFWSADDPGPFPTGVQIWIAASHPDMRKGMQGLALLVQEGLGRDPCAGYSGQIIGEFLETHLIADSTATVNWRR